MIFGMAHLPRFIIDHRRPLSTRGRAEHMRGTGTQAEHMRGPETGHMAFFLSFCNLLREQLVASLSMAYRLTVLLRVSWDALVLALMAIRTALGLSSAQLHANALETGHPCVCTTKPLLTAAAFSWSWTNKIPTGPCGW